ncbi:uncharacterized protein LOC112557145 [Pomacea canaliculata]|uniref:uncharacterized protein LOC112557145 n=1 Tax=Pomacea canaliculata TaxID=400727 RepID=UPI000D739D88|nr:uncharacterized protein LOC112557145 [Pomacea canaliculata]
MFDIDLDSTTVSLRPRDHLNITCFVQEKLEKKELRLWTPKEDGEREIIVEIVRKEAVSGDTTLIAEFELPNTYHTFLKQNEKASVTSRDAMQKGTHSKIRQHTVNVLVPDAGCKGNGFYKCRVASRVHLRDMAHMEWVSTRLQKQVILAESCGGKPGGDPVVNEIKLFESETGSEMEYGEEFDFTWLCRTSEDLGIRQCYQYFKIPATWHDAQEICQDQGGHLATIQNSMANSMVQLVFKLGRARETRMLEATCGLG